MFIGSTTSGVGIVSSRLSTNAINRMGLLLVILSAVLVELVV